MKNCVCIFEKLILGIGLVSLFLAGCKTEAPESQKSETVKPATVASNSFFWGTWVRMDNGESYEVLETKVLHSSETYNITSSTSTDLTVTTLGTFKKESDSVIINNNIPYFRNGGANLEYSLKIVGFTNGSSRAAGTSIKGIKGKAKSDKYSSFESEGESDDEGTIIFTAPTKDDTQTVTIENGDDIIIIPGLGITNDGDYMGTVALVGKDDYNLKITGTISEDQKDDGYLYGNNAITVVCNRASYGIFGIVVLFSLCNCFHYRLAVFIKYRIAVLIDNLSCYIVFTDDRPFAFFVEQFSNLCCGEDAIKFDRFSVPVFPGRIPKRTCYCGKVLIAFNFYFCHFPLLFVSPRYSTVHSRICVG